MERNPWKLATIGMALVGTTALGTGLTTSYMMRTPAPADAQETAMAPRPQRAAVASLTPVPRPLSRAAAPVAQPRVTPVSTAAAAAPADCDTGSERAIRIAKPGVIGALIGAGLGAAGGGIADGGKAAGKGALIGGLAGAALGGGYGAYKTKNECGTIFGDTFSRGFAGPASAATAQAFDGDRGQGITVYNAR
jgi:hypothetical protein